MCITVQVANKWFADLMHYHDEKFTNANTSIWFEWITVYVDLALLCSANEMAFGE